MRRSAALGVAVAALVLAAAPITAQDPLALGGEPGAPTLSVGGVLDDPALEDAVRSGLPLRMRFNLELWREELFDDLVDQTAWSVVVAFEPLERQFLTGVIGRDSLAAYASWEAVRTAVEGLYQPDLRPSRPGRYYYIAGLEIETLSLSDLDELERWLRGELEPAVQGRGTVGSAVGSGLKRLFIRILGLPARRYEARSTPFALR